MEEDARLLRSARLLPTTPDEVVTAFFTSSGFDVHPDRGFVPKPDPVARLADDSGFGPYEAVADELPHLLQSGRLRPTIDAMNGSTDPAELEALVHALPDDGARRRALLLLAGLANAYVWGGGPDVTPRDRIPACLAVPLDTVAALLETAPILSHQSNCLFNWRRTKGTEGEGTELRAEALDVCFSFTGERDEAMFYLLTLEIEGIGGPALADLETARRLVARLAPPAQTDDKVIVAAHRWLAGALQLVKARVDGMRGVMESMPRHVRPHFFYHRIRPYLTGWKGNPRLPAGVVYEGVCGDGEEVRRQLSGGSAAQSSIVAALDLYLGIDFGESSSYAFLKSMRAYMPRGHRRFLDALEAESRGGACSIRGYVLGLLGCGDGAREVAGVVAAYNACVDALVAFRRSHLSIVRAFILRQQQQQQAAQEEDETEEEEGGRRQGLEKAAGGKGTGGMPLLDFLGPLKEETEAARLASK